MCVCVWGGGGSDLSLNAVLFVPKWSGLSSPFLSSFGKLGVDFISISRFHTNIQRFIQRFNET